MSFVDNLNESMNIDYTANGAISNDTSLSNVLDFFSKSGAMRGHNSNEVITLFTKALSENEELALKALFYMRDILQGQGERENFKLIIRYLAYKYPKVISRVMKYIPVFGRWDDLYAFVGTPLESIAFDEIKFQLKKDLYGTNGVSLLAKWLKSENTSSKESRRLAKITRKYLGMTSSKYRKTLSTLRKRIDVVERKMSRNSWSNIDYEHVPSIASKNYVNAFLRHDNERYSKFVEDVQNGSKKINAKTLYPYDIIRSLVSHNTHEENKTYDALWNNLPNFISEENAKKNAIAVVDVSGSMYHGIGSVMPIHVSISLGIYLAERITGDFHNSFITFSEQPKLMKVTGKSIDEKVKNISQSSWGFNTNLQAVFDVILKTAIKHNTPKEEMPSSIFLISDMQFDQSIDDNKETNFKAIQRKYKEADYEMPQIVFWNVNAYSDMPVTKDEKGVLLVSGCSPSILSKALNYESCTAEEFMIEVLNSERYREIF